MLWLVRDAWRDVGHLANGRVCKNACVVQEKTCWTRFPGDGSSFVAKREDRVFKFEIPQLIILRRITNEGQNQL